MLLDNESEPVKELDDTAWVPDEVLREFERSFWVFHNRPLIWKRGDIKSDPVSDMEDQQYRGMEITFQPLNSDDIGEGEQN